MQKNKELSTTKSIDAKFLILTIDTKAASIEYTEYIPITTVNGNTKRGIFKDFE